MFGKPKAKTDRMPRLPQPADRLVGVLGRVHDVRPVDERGDARVDALQRAPQVAGVDVIGPIVRRELVEDGPEVGAERVVGRRRPDRRLPGVPMGVDEAGDDDVAIGLDDPRAIGGQVGGRPRRCGRPRRGRPRPRISPSASSWVSTIPPRMRIRSVTGSLPFSSRYTWCRSHCGQPMPQPRAPSFVSVRRWTATAEKSRPAPRAPTASRDQRLVDARLVHRHAEPIGQLE